MTYGIRKFVFALLYRHKADIFDHFAHLNNIMHELFAFVNNKIHKSKKAPESRASFRSAVSFAKSFVKNLL